MRSRNDDPRQQDAQDVSRESDGRFRALFENMSEGYAYCKMLFDDRNNPEDFIYLDVNGAFGKLTGLKDVIGRRATEVIPGVKESHPELFEAYGRVALTGQPEKFEVEIELLALWLSISVYSPEKGCFVAVFDVITERKQHEKALWTHREWLRVTLNSLGDGVMTADTLGRVTFLNRVAIALTGWQLEEAQGQPIQNVFQIDDDQIRAARNNIVARILKEEHLVEPDHHTLLVTRDGREIPVEERVSPIFDSKGKVVGVVLVFRAVTEKRRAEQELFETQQRLKALLEALPVGVNFSDDVTCQHISGNAAALAQFEAAPGDNISASAPDDNVPGRQAKFFREGHQISDSEMPVQRAVTEDRVIQPFELEIHLPSGRKWFAEASGAPIHDRQGNVIGGVAVTVDITDRKRAEDALLRSEKIKAAQEELGRLSGRLIEAQEKERSRIARELHDDICQQLALLSIEFDQAMQAAETRPLEAERRSSELAHFAEMKKASQHCVEIGRAVQALSHELHSSSLDYLGIVTACRGFCREFSEKQQLSVEFTSVDVPTFLPRDVSLCLFRVLQEALRNAAKHSGASCFKVSLQGARDEIELEVCDGGIGFDAEAVRAIGGLGLLSMEERVNLVKGKISIESRPGEGTKVRARIPVIGMSKQILRFEPRSAI
jgi:PAS domain S-box-containing protein